MIPNLNTFLTVYQTRSFNKAAEILFISQSTVSTQIKKLENKLGQPLFVRHKREQVRPTSEGERLYPQALEMITKWNDIKNTFTNQLGAKVQIVASHSAAHLIVPDIMPLIDNDQSNISIAVSNSNDILRAVLDEKAQIGFIEKPLSHENIVQLPIFNDELVLAGDSSSKTLFIRELGSGVRFYSDRYLQESHPDQHLLEISDNSLILDLVKRGLGQSVLSKNLIDQDTPYQTLGPQFKREINLIYSKSETSYQVKKFISAINHLFKKKYS
ncbi:LysR family transcriptional regulator [Fructobacillus fructosus]|uniref:LysR family transcriptional regulator n=1 Tax=Fructobacillus fructosus TaxID=1631 RepID=UPI0040340072